MRDYEKRRGFIEVDKIIMDIIDKAEKNWQERQIANWRNDKNEIVKFFSRFNLDVADVYDHVTSLDYNKMQVICYLLSKVGKAIKICDFLDDLKKKEHADVDVIKIYLLISHAEIAMNNLGIKDKKIEMVKKFFDPVVTRSGLYYKIRMDSGNTSSPEILYKIRCEYTHEGNYTGIIFKQPGDDCSNLFRFRSGNKDVYGQCNLTYQEFLNIFMDALVENIKIFSNYE